MNALVDYLRGKGTVSRAECARALGVSIRHVRELGEESRLYAERWDQVVLSTLEGLRLARDYGELVEESARIRSQHLRALKQCANMERLCVDAKQGLLNLAVWVVLLIPYWMLA